jgi:hypothetical protein
MACKLFLIEIHITRDQWRAASKIDALRDEKN